MADKRLDAKISQLQGRIRPPGWAAIFEHARDHRVADTGHWLFNDPTFCRQVGSSNRDNGQRNVLFVSGEWFAI